MSADYNSLVQNSLLRVGGEVEEDEHARHPV